MHIWFEIERTISFVRHIWGGGKVKPLCTAYEIILREAFNPFHCSNVIYLCQIALLPWKVFDDKYHTLVVYHYHQ